MKNRDKKIVILSFSLFLIMSLILFSVIFFVIEPLNGVKLKDRVYIEADIINIYKINKNRNKVTVLYKIDNEEYTGNLGTYIPVYHFKKNVKIYYDKNDPLKIGTNDMAYFYYSLVALILLFNWNMYNRIADASEKNER